VEDRTTNYATKVMCWMLCVINVGMACFFFGWVVYYRKHQVVRYSQRNFLAAIAVGGAVSSLTIIPITFTDELDWDVGLARTGEFTTGNQTCMASVWLYSLGFVLTFTPLFVKSWRLSRLVSQNDRHQRVKKVTNAQLLGIMSVLVAVDAGIILAWTVSAPLQFFRVTNVQDEVGNPVTSVGLCYSENDSMVFVVLLTMFHLAVLLYGNYICYSIKHLADTGLSEFKYVQVALFSNLQVLGLALPVIVIVADDPVSSMFVRSSVIFLNDACTMILIFMPKVLAVAGKIQFDTLAGAQKSETTKRETHSTEEGRKVVRATGLIVKDFKGAKIAPTSEGGEGGDYHYSGSRVGKSVLPPVRTSKSPQSRSTVLGSSLGVSGHSNAMTHIAGSSAVQSLEDYVCGSNARTQIEGSSAVQSSEAYVLSNAPTQVQAASSAVESSVAYVFSNAPTQVVALSSVAESQ
jgi:hypothetical protein